MIHDNKFKWDANFSSKTRKVVYEIEQLRNDEDEVSFNI